MKAESRQIPQKPTARLKFVCYIYFAFRSRAGVANQSETKSHISLVCCHKEPHHTDGHSSTSPHPFLTYTHTFAQLDLL